jgi:hypothetical protein
MPAGKLSVAQFRLVLGKISAGTPVVVTAATNATPPVLTATAHGLQTGDSVVVAAVGGNTNCNVVANPVTVVDANNFSLNGIAGNSAYTSGGTVTRLFSAIVPSDVDSLQGSLSHLSLKNQYLASEVTVQALVEALTVV